MVGSAQFPQRQVTVRGEDQGQQPGFQCHVTVHQPDADKDRDDGHRDGGDELQRERGQEGGPQRPHGPPSILLREVLKGLALGSGAAEPNEHGQALGEFQHVAGEPRQRRPGFPDALIGVPADQDHKHRHQRDGQHNHNGTDPVGEQNAGSQQQRERSAVHQGREVLGVVAVQGIQSPGRENGKAAVGGPGGPGAAAQRTRQQLRTQFLLHTQCSAARRCRLRPDGQGAQHHPGNPPVQLSVPGRVAGHQAGQHGCHRLADQHEGQGLQGREQAQQVQGCAVGAPPGELRSHQVLVLGCQCFGCDSREEAVGRRDVRVAYPAPEHPVRPCLVGEHQRQPDAGDDGHQPQGVVRGGGI
ncbi:hypothetical protein BJQ89_00259 [Arthrobacter sp. ES1]|nr:hypothetical protein [Arthrobacter sp. ES1]